MRAIPDAVGADLPVNRRQLGMLAAAGGAALAARPARALGRRLRVAVVGAGILGTSIAYHLAMAGADVAVVEKASPGAGATQGAFAMLISTHDGGVRAFNDLYSRAILDWRRIERELAPVVRVAWGGLIRWAPPGAAAEQIRRSARQLEGWGAAVRIVDAAQMQRLSPGLAPGPVGAASFSSDTGCVDPMQALGALQAAATRLGAGFRYPCEARALTLAGDRLTGVATSDGPLEADVVVLAAGTGTPELAGAVGVRTPISIVSGTLAHSRPHPRALDTVLVGPAGSLKQDPDGRVVIGPDYRPGAHGSDVSAAYGERLLAAAARIAPALAGAELEAMTIGHVPIPVDTHPIVGFCARPANLYVALTMSGITMAPLMGRLAACEIVDRVPVEMLSDYRPGRFG